jgi:hypothetical protein
MDDRGRNSEDRRTAEDDLDAEARRILQGQGIDPEEIQQIVNDTFDYEYVRIIVCELLNHIRKKARRHNAGHGSEPGGTRRFTARVHAAQTGLGRSTVYKWWQCCSGDVGDGAEKRPLPDLKTVLLSTVRYDVSLNTILRHKASYWYHAWWKTVSLLSQRYFRDDPHQELTLLASVSLYRVLSSPRLRQYIEACEAKHVREQVERGERDDLSIADANRRYEDTISLLKEDANAIIEDLRASLPDVPDWKPVDLVSAVCGWYLAGLTVVSVFKRWEIIFE